MSIIVWIILGMAIVTYIPRVVPFVWFDAEKMPPRLKGILQNVPYAILGALIFPGMLTAGDDLIFGLIGTVVAFSLAFLGANLIHVVLGTIAALTVYGTFF